MLTREQYDVLHVRYCNLTPHDKNGCLQWHH